MNWLPARITGAGSNPPSSSAHDSNSWNCYRTRRPKPPPTRFLNAERPSAIATRRQKEEQESAAVDSTADDRNRSTSPGTQKTPTLVQSSAVETGKPPSKSEEGTPSSPHPWRRSPETKLQRKTDPRRTADMDRPNPKLPRSSLGKQELNTGRPIQPPPPILRRRRGHRRRGGPAHSVPDRRTPSVRPCGTVARGKSRGTLGSLLHSPHPSPEFN